MKKNIAKKWVEALESGNYRQVDGVLKKRVNDKQCGYCCLGVLCDLYIKETGKGQWSKGGDDEGDRHFTGKNKASTDLPKEVVKWAGMASDGGTLNTQLTKEAEDYLGKKYLKIANNLIELNDDFKYNFKQIAKVIKEQAAKL